MKKSTKISIVSESRELFILYVEPGTPLRGHCAECGAEVEMLSLDLTVTLTGRRAHELLRLMESGAIHARETAAGHLLMCRNSLRGTKL